jgi:multiple sugar transport system substrate-binding protein
MKTSRRSVVLGSAGLALGGPAVLAALAACAPGTGGGAGGAGGGAEGAAAPSKAPVTVRYAHGWSTLYLDRMDKIVADFTAKHPTVKAEHVRLQDNSKLHEELATALAAGTPPDVSMQWRGAMPGLAAKGGLTALDPYLKRDRFDPSIYYDNEFKSSQFQGRTYVLPMAATGAWYLIFYNRDHFRDAGLDENRPPTTWDEAARYAGVLTRKGADGKIERLGFEPGFKDASIFNSPLVAWSATSGGAFASADGRRLQFDSPQGAAALEFMLRTLQQIGGREALDDYVSRNRASNDSFTNAQRAMLLTNHSFPARLKAVAPDLRYGIGTLPKGSAGGAPGIVRGGWANSVPTGVKAPHEAWLLTQYLSATREGGGWFMQEQVRPSPIKAANESPVYNDLPHWNVIKQALAADVLMAATPLDTELDTLTAAAVGEVYQGKTSPKDALAFAQREGQRRLDEFWASVKR